MNKPIIKPTTTPRAPAIITRLPDPDWTGERQESIIHNDFGGFILTTGFRGKGKTSLALKWDKPENILFIDCEDKGKTLVGQLPIGAYFQPMTEAVGLMGSGLDIQFVYDRIHQIVDKAPAGRFTTLVLDNASFLQEGAAQAVKKSPALAQQYGVLPQNAISGSFGGAWPAVKYMIRALMHTANQKGIKIINATFQLKDAWANGKPMPGKFQTTNVTTWHEQSVLTLVLVDPIPEHFPNRRALVMKESFSTMAYDSDTKRVVQKMRLPPAIPCATPYEIYNYLDQPWDPKNPKPGELVTNRELAPFTPTFGEEELYTFQKMVELQERLLAAGSEGE